MSIKLRPLLLPAVCLVALVLQPLTMAGLEWKPLKPGPNDATTAILTARMLERTHYSQKSFNDTVSSAFLTQYLNFLDPQHLYFLESDALEFEPYRNKLDELTVNAGDTSPAYEIFNRFIERLRQQHAYATRLLQTETFEFNTDDRFTVNRKDEPRPRNIQEARQLWRDRLRFEYLTEKLNQKKPEEIVKTITKRYDNTLKMMEGFDADRVLASYLTALSRVFDPHTDYMSKSELDNFQIGMKLSLVGIGAQLTTDDGYCKILELVAGGPAARSKKLKPNDRIVAVAQGDQEPVDVIDMPLEKIVEKIRGAEGTQVRLTVIPADAADATTRTIVTLVREKIKLEDQEAKAQLIELPAGNGKSTRLGVIDLPSFYADLELDNQRAEGERKSTTRDVSRLLAKLKQEKVAGIILDLRRNGGGSLEEAIKLTGLFIQQGPVVQVKDPTGEIQIDKDNDPRVDYEGPLVVLTSRFSASASEILAGALQDYGRAVIVGDSSTHGKGTVQTMITLGRYLRAGSTPDYDPGALKVTIRKFYRPSGASTQLKGVVPDIILPSVNNHADFGESSLDNPLEWDTIEAAPFQQVNQVAPVLDVLRQRSAKRVEQSREFGYLREDIERFKKLREEKTVTLNEATRLKEKDELKGVQEQRKQERKKTPETHSTTYKISLKQASQPGLPEPFDPKKAKEEKPARASLNDEPAAAAEEDSQPQDVVMSEAEKVLLDLISLLANKNALVNR